MLDTFNACFLRCTAPHTTLVVPALFRCAEAFVSAGRHDAAVRLLVKGRQLEQALDLLLAHEVPLTEELAEALTPPKAADNADQRNAVLLRLAQVRGAAGTQKHAYSHS